MGRRQEEILGKAREGERITVPEALEIYERAPLPALGETAHALRLSRTDPSIVTYLIDRNVNYTNFCVTDCLFCAFYRPMGHREGYVLPLETILEKVAELDAVGGTRVLLQGGHNPDLGIDFYVGMFTALKEAFPHIQLDALSPSEVDHIAVVEDLALADVLGTLSGAGQDGLPGGGAEILDDAIRGRISRKKIPGARWLEAMEIAQGLGMTTSATQVIGFGETIAQRLAHLEKFRDHQDRARRTHGNGFTSFISWTYQKDNTALGRIGDKKGWNLGADGEEYLRHVAVSRIFLDNFENHQASWPTQGREIARRALGFGCNDFGSTMMEENVVSAAGSSETPLTESGILDEIRAAGFDPVQRDSNYRLVDREPARRLDG